VLVRIQVDPAGRTSAEIDRKAVGCLVIEDGEDAIPVREVK